MAIKLLHPDLVADAAVVARLVRERLALTRLVHPHVVRARDLVVDGDILALVMDLVEGTSLRGLLDQRGRFPAPEAIRLGAQMAAALAAAHTVGIVHRDLKPGNILLDMTEAEPSVRVADLGIATVAGDRTVTASGEILGTVSYMAPESIRGETSRPAVDVYALGIILFEMCTGRPAFAGEGVEAVLHHHLSTVPKRPEAIPASLWAIVAQCLEKSPDARPAAAHLAQRLSALGRGLVLAVAAPGGQSPHPNRGETRRLLRPDLPPTTASVPDRGPFRWWKPLAWTLSAAAVAAIAFAATQMLRPMPPPAGPTPAATALQTWDLDQWPYDVIANGLGPVERGLSVGGEAPGDGTQISLAGTAYERGLGVHAFSHLRIGVYGACQRFRAKVGVDDQSAGSQTGTVVVTIQADGETLFEEELSWESGARDIDVDLTGRQTLDLIVSDAGDGSDGDAVSWANAGLESCKG